MYSFSHLTVIINHYDIICHQKSDYLCGQFHIYQFFLYSFLLYGVKVKDDYMESKSKTTNMLQFQANLNEHEWRDIIPSLPAMPISEPLLLGLLCLGLVVVLVGVLFKLF